MLISILIILACMVGIWIGSETLSKGTDQIGKRYNLNPGVRGATLDAVSSSFAEFCTTVIALYQGSFDAGVGTIAGSALFNVLVIPAMASLAAGGITVHKSVIKRDGMVYLAVVFALISLLYFGPQGSNGNEYRVVPMWSGAAAIISYILYVIYLFYISKKASKNSDTEKDYSISLLKSGFRIIIGMAFVGIACHYLVEITLDIFRTYNLSEAVAGVTVLAAATSIPDTLISVFAAKRGDGDGAVANAFASNTFDILICLGVPVLIYQGLEMNWAEGAKILVCLLISTFISVLFMITDWKITRWEGAIKIGIYIAFCIAVFNGFI